MVEDAGIVANNPGVRTAILLVCLDRALAKGPLEHVWKY
jgi:hypothetical protein